MSGKQPAPSARSEFLGGVKALLPLTLGIFPFGIIYGVMALESGLTPLQAQAMSSMVFAGSSQIVLCQLLAGSAPLLVVFFTVFVINLRHILYSASVAPHVGKLTMTWKLVLSYFLTDEAYATAIAHLESSNSPKRHYFLLGSGIALWSAWQLSTLAGILIGKEIPPEWGFDFAIPLAFIALVVPRIKTKADLAAVVISAIASIVFLSLPLKLSLIVATLLGVLAGLLLSPKSSVPSIKEGRQ